MSMNDSLTVDQKRTADRSIPRTPRQRWLCVLSDGLWFARAYCAIQRVHRELDRGGWNEVRRRLQQERVANVRRQGSHELVQRIERAVVSACRWQWRPTACLPRSIVAYRLLRSAGFHPELCIALRVPILGHAWTQLNGTAVADDMTPAEREDFTILTRLPSDGVHPPALSASVSQN